MTNFLIIFIAIMALTLPASADLTFNDSFENYDMGAKNFFDKSNLDLWKPSVNSANYYEIVGSPTRSGKKAIKFYNHRVSATNGYRSEAIAWAGLGSGRALYFKIGEEYWLGFSIYLPEDFVCDGCKDPNYNNEIHGQFHGTPDRGSRTRPGYEEEEYRNPPIALLIIEDKWIIFNKSDSNPVTVNRNYERKMRYDIGSWLEDKGKWTDWVFHFKLDYTKNGDNGGFFKVYKNGVLVVNDKGGNCYNDLLGPYFQFGTYKFSWKSGPTDTDTRIVYFDEIKIGDKNSNFYDVSPRDSTPPASIQPDSPKNLILLPVR